MKNNIDLSKLTDEERKELIKNYEMILKKIEFIKEFNKYAPENEKKRMYYFDGVHFGKSKF